MIFAWDIRTPRCKIDTETIDLQIASVKMHEDVLQNLGISRQKPNLTKNQHEPRPIRGRDITMIVFRTFTVIWKTIRTGWFERITG